MSADILQASDAVNTSSYTSSFSKPLNECVDINIPINEVKEGEFKYFPWVKGKIGIYRPKAVDVVNLQDNALFPALVGLPPWWKEEDNPAVGSMLEYATHNVNEGVFIFWGWSPILGCELFHFPSNLGENAPQNVPKFVGKNWEGGFIDLCTMRAFDYAGRLVAIDKAFEKNKNFPSYVLVKPHYTIKNDVIHLDCKL